MTQIPTIASHRGIGIHDRQGAARIKVAKAAIDRVARMSDVLELADFAADSQQPPEARMFAANKIEVEYEVAAEERRNRPIIDLEKVRATVPKLIDLTEKVLFGDVWERPGLSKRDRSLVTCAALIALNRTEQLKGHLERALNNGVTPEEIGELITHLAFYGGWPVAMSGALVANDVLAQHKR